MSARNRWITFANDFIARWGAFLPPPLGNEETLVRFANGVVEAGRRSRVYQAIRLPAAEPYEAGSRSFADYLSAQVGERRRVPVFPREELPGSSLWTPAHIAFYRGDALVEEDIGDAGALLRELRPDRVGTGSMFMRAASPVAVVGASIPLDWTQEVRVQIRLDTDIWFPCVMGMLEEIPDEGDKPDLYDNRELACRHTPRLNAFLEEVRQLALDLGGRWEILDVDGVAVNYRHMWNETGILL